MSELPPLVTRSELRVMPANERARYVEGVWMKCDACFRHGRTPECPNCAGQGAFLQMQHSVRVVDASQRTESDVPVDWKIGDPL